MPPVACPGCQARDRRVAELEQAVTELQRRLDEPVAPAPSQAAAPKAVPWVVSAVAFAPSG
jgi:anti-sigma factor RsiW